MAAHFTDTWTIEGVIDYEQGRHDRVSKAHRQPGKVTFGGEEIR